jgi:hypothetical protein
VAFGGAGREVARPVAEGTWVAGRGLDGGVGAVVCAPPRRFQNQLAAPGLGCLTRGAATPRVTPVSFCVTCWLSDVLGE